MARGLFVTPSIATGETENLGRCGTIRYLSCSGTAFAITSINIKIEPRDGWIAGWFLDK